MTLMGAVPLTGGSSMTAEGEIPHKRIIWRGYAIDAPVKIKPYDCARTADRLPRVARHQDGRLIYMLPCGAEIPA